MNRTRRLYEYVAESSSAPGDTLQGTLHAVGMTQHDLACRTGLSAKTISGIIHGKEPLSQDTALQLETVLGVPASVWNNLERQYQESRARSTQLKEMRAQKTWLDKFPMRQLLDLGWVERCDDSAQKVLALLRFFGCASPDQCETYLQRLAVQYRTSEAFTADDYALSAWLRQGERMAQELDCSPYEGDVFRRALQEARRLTTEAPMVFVPELQQLCGDAGVAVAFVHELPGIRASGAARWLTPSKALIQLDLRYKSDDQLWFSFFHEAGHILLHGKRQFFLEEREDALDNMEQEADAFASDVLIPAPAYRDFVQKAVFTSSAILTFAGKQGIAPGIVVGRLQHEHHVPFNALNGLKRKIVWADT